MGAYDNLDQAIAGLKLGIDMDRVETWKAAETIAFGAPVFVYEGDDVGAYNVKQDTATITLDADLVTGNTITTTVTVDGVAQAAVATPFNTDHDTTMDDHVTNLEAGITGLDVTLTDATNNRQFTLFLKGSDLTAITSPVTGGASQAGVTMAYTTAQVFAGVALYTSKSEVDTVGTYVADETVNVLAEGQVWINTDGAVSSNTNAYVVWDATSADQGKFTATATDNYDVGCKFRSDLAAAGLALVEVRGQVKDATP